MSEGQNESAVIRGEFFTDGASFIFKLDGVPISGAGPSPQAAFDNLLSAQAASGDLQHKLLILSRDQRDDQARAALIRLGMIWLIALTLAGGVVAALVVLSPQIAADVADIATSAMSAEPPAAEQ